MKKMEDTSTLEITFPKDLREKDFDVFVPKGETLTALLNLDQKESIALNGVQYETKQSFQQNGNSFKFATVDPMSVSPRIHIHSESSLETGGIPQKMWDIDVIQSEPLETGEFATKRATYTSDGKLFSICRSIILNTPPEIAARHPVTSTHPFTSFSLEERNNEKYLTVGITDDYEDPNKVVLSEFVVRGGDLLSTNSKVEMDEVYVREAKKMLPILI